MQKLKLNKNVLPLRLLNKLKKSDNASRLKQQKSRLKRKRRLSWPKLKRRRRLLQQSQLLKRR